MSTITLKTDLLVGASAIHDKSILFTGLHVRFTGPVGISVDATQLFKGADVTLLISTVLLVLFY